MPSDKQPDHTEHDDLVEKTEMVFAVLLATNALKAATSQEYRDKLHRRAELREELGAPEWMPAVIEPYYNISTWTGRLAFLIGEISVASPVNWYRYAVLSRIASWAFHVEISTRWEEHDDWI